MLNRPRALRPEAAIPIYIRVSQGIIPGFARWKPLMIMRKKFTPNPPKPAVAVGPRDDKRTFDMRPKPSDDRRREDPRFRPDQHVDPVPVLDDPENAIVPED